MLSERLACLREAGTVLYTDFSCSVINLVKEASHSAASLVNLLTEHFPCFSDVSRFQSRRVNFFKRAQIFIADLWAAFDGESYGRFDDIDAITVFADYRIPQMLHHMGCLSYSPPLQHAVSSKRILEPGSDYEVQIRGCSIWCVELLRREILRLDPTLRTNAVLIDFYLYDTIKAQLKNGEKMLPHHRTRSIWY
jgi:hypothetical protein